MANSIDVKVPDLGDFSDVEIIEVLVQPGDVVATEDGLITLETDKAVMDVPAPCAGEVLEIVVQTGDRVSAGDNVLTLRSADEAESVAVEADSQAPADPASATLNVPTLVEIRVPNLGDFDKVEVIEVMLTAGERIEAEAPVATLETDKAAMDVPSPVSGVIREVLVSTGDYVSAGDLLARCDAVNVVSPAATDDTKTPATSAAPAAEVTQTVAVAPTAGAVPATLPKIEESSFRLAHASPTVRKFARELGVDLGRIRGSGFKSRITADDVKAFVKSVMMGDAAIAAGPAWPSVPQVDYAKYGEIELQPLTRIQKISGPRLHASWVNIPHVTHNDEADFTDTDQTRKRMKETAAAQDVRLTPLAFVLRACVLALQQMPLLNTSLSHDGKSLIMKKYINLGFAADTPNGLVVPVIHNAQDLSVIELARELGELSANARDGKLQATKMQGATFTVSSLGGIGGTSFTPIINAPEVAILGVSRARMTAVYSDGDFKPRLMLPLSLSYDHRVIDGANAARFTALLAQLAGDPAGLVAE